MVGITPSSFPLVVLQTQHGECSNSHKCLGRMCFLGCGSCKTGKHSTWNQFFCSEQNVKLVIFMKIPQIWGVRICSFPLATCASSEEWKPLHHSQNMWLILHFHFVSWAYKSSRNLYFYPWALSTAKLIRHCWPPGGAQTQPAASASCLRARQDSSKEGISIGAVQGQPPLDAVSAAIWPRNAQNKTTPGKGKTSQTRGQVGQCAMGRCWEVRECDCPLCCEWLCLYREFWPQT